MTDLARLERQKNSGKLLGAVELANRSTRRVLIKSTPLETIVDSDGREWKLRRLPSLASAGPRAQEISTRRPRPSFRIA